MKNFLLVLLVVFAFLLPSFISKTNADELDDKYNQLQSQINSLKTQYNEKNTNYQKLNAQLLQIKAQLVVLEGEIKKKEQEVETGEEALIVQRNLLNERAKSYYKNINKSTVSFLDIFVGANLSTSLENFFYQKTLVDQDRNVIIKIVLYIKNLEEKKASLQSDKVRLASLQQEVDKQSKVLGAEVSSLQQQIAVLTQQQQSVIAQKLAGLNIPRSAGTSLSGCVDDRDKDPGFSPRLAFYTYGVPNRTGLNQYGAKGRADAGQNAEQILQAYYQSYDLKKDYDTGITINVDGYSSYNIEDYVKRIYEMPGDWSIEALKAQAIAARSYALAYTNNGQGSICATESCQVFKPDEKGGNWNAAVEATRGWVMVQGDSPIKAWYSSTHGGYVLATSELPGWSSTSYTKHATDTTTGSAGGFGDLQSNAYDKSSPWFYCDWGSRSNYSSTAWLKQDEVADIANVILLARLDSSTSNHLYQPDKPNPAGTDTWDNQRVKDELRNRGGNPYNSVSDVSVGADFGGGKTTSINVSGDAGSQGFDGGEWKNWFNLRAPANIQIVGPLYNTEKR